MFCIEPEWTEIPLQKSATFPDIPGRDSTLLYSPWQTSKNEFVCV